MVGRPKFHDIKKRLRRYNLLGPPLKKSRVEPTEDEQRAKRAKNAAYLREWRRTQSIGINTAFSDGEAQPH